MTTKYVRLQNGKKMEIYDCVITNSCILKFINTDVETVKTFLGTDLIDAIDIIDSDDKLISNHTLNMKRKTILFENTTITEYEERIVKEAYDEVVRVPIETTTPDTIEGATDGTTEETVEGETTNTEPKYEEKTIHHDAVKEKIAKEVPVELITAILEKPSFEEELDVVKSTVGIVNTNNMTLDEFKTYYKGVIGKACTAAIEGGSDVETSFGTQHFSYTIEDQSNIKDLIITGIISDYSLPLPYHADGHLCDTYQPEDILKIYMALSSNKTYHTTYCNILNAMIAEAKDMDSVKAITYGMEITDTKYTDVISKINNSKDALLKLVEEKVKAMASK